MRASIRAAVTAAILVASPAAATAQDQLTVLLDWFVNPDHAPLIIAEHRGTFAANDLEVELIAPSDPAAPPRLVAAGQGDIAITYQPSLYQQVNEGLPVMRVGTVVSTPLNSLVALADGPVQSLSDLEGLTVGYSVGGFEDALLGRMLASVDLTLDDVTLVNVNFALTPALVSGRVDAVIGAFRNFELTQLRLEGREGRAFLPEEHGVPSYEELIFITARERADAPEIARFMAVMEKTVAAMLADPAAAEADFFAARPDIDDALNRQAFKDTLPLFAEHPAALDKDGYEAFARFMAEAGLVDDLPPLQSYAAEVR